MKSFAHASVAGFLSLMFPGLGQLYNSQGRKAVIFSSLFGLLMFLVMVVPVWLPFGYNGFVAFYGAALLVRFFCVVDAIVVPLVKAPPEKRFQGWKQFCLVGVLLLFAALGLKFGFYTARIGIYGLPSSSMSPTLPQGSFVVVDRNAYADGDPQRMDIVIFRNEYEQLPDLVKRIAGVPGDELELREGSIFLNEEKVDYPASGPAINDFPLTRVPAGKYFMLGDNINNSKDSRIVGPIERERINAKVLFILWGEGAGRAL